MTTNKRTIITTDSTADLCELFDTYDIPRLPLAVNLGADSYIDGVNITPLDIFDYVGRTKQLPKTAARSIGDFQEFFDSLLTGNVEIVHIGIADKLSASYANAVLAAEGKPVHVIDGNNLSTGTGLLVLYAKELAQSGEYSAEQIVEMVTKRVPAVQASFVVDTLDYLHKGGRCSGVANFAASVLSLKPTIIVQDGRMIVGKKYMGKFEKSILKYVDDVFAKYNTPDLTRIFITHSYASDEIVAAVKNKIATETKFKEIIVTIAGGTITSHCGRGTLGILFINDGNTK